MESESTMMLPPAAANQSGGIGSAAGTKPTGKIPCSAGFTSARKSCGKSPPVRQSAAKSAMGASMEKGAS